jgi:hypothetical protein
MGFGLHMGWAIEGAIGSSYKIDASYLSPNVNMAARLEAATKQYGVTILISGALYDCLSDDIKAICRLIDIVTVKGSLEPVKLYTIDVNPNITIQKPKEQITSYKEKMRIFKDKKENLLKLAEEEEEVGIAKIVLSKNSFRELLTTNKTKKFYETFREAFKYYIGGVWDVAGKLFEECLKLDETDGPTKTLYQYIKEKNFKPVRWKGYRDLTSK